MARLPDEIFTQVHQHADLLKYGISRDELSGPLWQRVHHGRYRFGITEPNDALRRIVDSVGMLPPGGVLGGWAAAFLHGVRDLDGRRWSGQLEPVLFVLPYHRKVSRPGIATIRTPLAPEDLTEHDGATFHTSPNRTCFDLMRLANSLEDAVVAVDAMLRAKVVTLEGLRAFIDTRRGWKGVPQARAALDLADEHTASCPESRLRVVWVVEARLPKPLVNVPVYGRRGELLGIPDLFDIATGLVGEYDGAQHRDLQHHSDDNIREEALEAHNLTVVRATSIDLRRGRRTFVARLRNGHTRAQRRDRTRDAWCADW